MTTWGQRLTSDDRRWLEMRWSWLQDEFGKSNSSRVILPTAEFFAETYDGELHSVERVLEQVCGWMRVRPQSVQLRVFDGSQNPTEGSPSAAGLYVEENGHFQIWVEFEQTQNLDTLVATLAHELGHVKLLGERRISSDCPDHELLTDLLTVFMGLGVFTANSTILESNWNSGAWSGWRMSRQGYLSLPMYGHAHALLASDLPDSNPTWSRYLRKDARVIFHQSLKETATASHIVKRQTIDREFIAEYARSVHLAGGTSDLVGADEDEKTTFTSEATCHYCGEPVTDDQDICVECQESIDENSQELAMEKAEAETGDKWLNLTLALIAILFVGLLVYGLFFER